MKVCFFTSIGDDLSLVENVSNSYDYDIIANYYGDNNDVYERLKVNTKYCFKNKLSKFQSVKKYYDYIKEYNYTIIFDDDAILTKGNLDQLLIFIDKYQLDIISPAHDPKGKISHIIHLPIEHTSSLRKVNFVEMNFPIFSNKFLCKFLEVYDGTLTGWGIDYIYSSMSNNIAICDDVIVLNPNDSNKINNLCPLGKRINQWKCYSKEFSIEEIIPENLGFI